MYVLGCVLLVEQVVRNMLGVAKAVKSPLLVN